MRVILLAIVSAIAIAGLSAIILDSSYQQTGYNAFATVGARVGDAGSNLVGKDWAMPKR